MRRFLAFWASPTPPRPPRLSSALIAAMEADHVAQMGVEILRLDPVIADSVNVVPTWIAGAFLNANHGGLADGDDRNGDVALDSVRVKPHSPVLTLQALMISA